jgi:ribonuclease BN (tRNA processing enzyme)
LVHGLSRILILFLVLMLNQAYASSTCPPTRGVALQILGSGGPVADDDRASSAYLVWVDGRARVMVDVGGGSFQRFGAAGAQFEDLELVALSHFHTDHSADFPTLLKTGYFSRRQEPLPVSGPTGQAPFPSLAGYLNGLLNPETGVYAYLAGYLDGSNGLVRLDTIEVEHASGEAVTVLKNSRLEVTAMGVPHGIVPSLAYRIDVNGQRIVFASDQNGGDPRFIDFARGADLFIAHLAVPESASGAAVRLHARPSAWAGLAQDSGAQNLLLSHFMARSLSRLDTDLFLIKNIYSGTVVLAYDGSCHFLNNSTP